MLVIACVGLVVDLAGLVVLHRRRGGSLAVRGALARLGAGPWRGPFQHVTT